jgi:16S rRNA (cytidine1402-2'-O)-methyltransferase
MNDSTALFLVPTPIGNLQDITYRAVEVLKQVDLILAEDTRTSGVLLKHYQITTPLKSFHAHNEHHQLDSIINMLESGKRLALISDAGMPGISDPGFLLSRAALERDLKVEVLPGATAFIPALLKSGFPLDEFVFEGFLPHKKGRQTKIKSWNQEKRTIVCYESPHRLLKLLEQLKELLDHKHRRISISRELTKKFEETRTGTVEELLKHFQSNPPKGEFVVVLEAEKKS